MLKLIFLFLSILPITAQSEEFSKYIGFDLGKNIGGYTISQEMIILNSPQCENDAYTLNCATPNIRKKQHSPFLNLYAGHILDKYTAFEIGAFKNFIFTDFNNRKQATVKIEGLHMGFVFTLPVYQDILFLPGVGVSYASVILSTPNYFARENGIIPRLMAGLQYKLTEKLNLRGSLVWNYLSNVYNRDVIFHNTFNIGIGINYMFERLISGKL